MWWQQEKSPSLSSSTKSLGKVASARTGSVVEAGMMIVPTSEEFRKLSPERQSEELFILIQRLLPLQKRVDYLSEAVASLSSSKQLASSDHEDITAQDSDSLYKSLTSLPGATAEINTKPDPFIIKRSKEINRYCAAFSQYLLRVMVAQGKTTLSNQAS